MKRCKCNTEYKMVLVSNKARLSHRTMGNFYSYFYLNPVIGIGTFDWL